MLWHEHGWKVIWERMLSVGLWDPSGMCGEACCSAGLLIEICGISENRLSCHCWHHCSHASHPLKTEREGEEERRGETDVAYWGSVFVPPYPSCTQCSIRVFWLRTSQHAARQCHHSIFWIHNTIADLDLFWVLLSQTTLAYNRKPLFFSMHRRFLISTVKIFHYLYSCWFSLHHFFQNCYKFSVCKQGIISHKDWFNFHL